MPPLILLIALPVLSAVAVQRLMFANLDRPPSDYGTGTMFDSIAPRYDMINRVLALGMDIGWRKRMVAAVKDSLQRQLRDFDELGGPPVKILDLATGTADVAILLAQEVPTAEVIGVDPSANMLKIGRDKVQKSQLSSHVTLQQHDAQNLAALTESSFDGATMAFGIRNVPNRPDALCQIHKVLKPDARFCILEFSEPDGSAGVLGRVATVFIRHVIPVVGGILSGAPREYWHLQNSIKDFPSPAEFATLLESLQCVESGGDFHLEELVQMNFGSVQLYVTRVRKRPNYDSDRVEAATSQ
jgi:demethylmenaquinone methyltransferase / 2-methoxy-6-polyprenyl-1,4-benzoquinol methylase